MNSKPFIATLFLLILLASARIAAAMETFDFDEVVILDADGQGQSEFRPGQTVRYEARFSLGRPGIALIHGTVRGADWSRDLGFRIRIGLSGSYSVTWQDSLPARSEGQARIDVTLVSPLHERLIRSDFFTVTPIDADYVGADVCSSCHSALFESWESSRHAPAVDCESCHGPASEHIATLSPDFILIDKTAELCGMCHSKNNGLTIEAQDGFIKNMQQLNEWQSSAHAQTKCSTCHNPHYSLISARSDAIKVSCRQCHADKTVSLNMQRLMCEDCHMPKAVLNEHSDGVGDYRQGDVASHIWRIKGAAEPDEMFTPGGTALQQDIEGNFLTLNFTCLGCHDGKDERLESFEAVRQTFPLIH